jgi:5'-nucleotidase
MKRLIIVTTILILASITGCSLLKSFQPTPTATPFPTATPVPVLPPIRTPENREPLPAEGIVKFQILHWNDFHGELGERVADGQYIPGAARLVTVVQGAEARYGRERTLILDGGDFFQGSPNVQKAGGVKVLELYKRLGVDAITVGNHEFFSGVSKFLQVASMAAPIEILSVNLRKWGPEKSCSDNPIVNAYKIFELGEPSGPKVRIAVIGAGAYALELNSYSTIVGICFSRPADEIIKIYDQLVAEEKPDVIVVLSHSGLAEDESLANALNAAGKPVDIIIGGHSHTYMDAPEMVGNIQIIQAGDHGREVGVFELSFNRSTKVLKSKWYPLYVNECTPQDPETAAFLADTIISPTSIPQVCIPTPTPDVSHPFLAAIEPVSVSVGYWSLGIGVFPASDTGMNAGETINSHDVTYNQGLFAHAPSNISYLLDGQYKSFKTVISVKETACGDGGQFVVKLDGIEAYRSPWMTAASDPIPVSLDVSGASQITLVTISGADNSCDWTIWGDPSLTLK